MQIEVMTRLVVSMMLLGASACGQKDAGTAQPAGSAAPAPPAAPVPADAAVPPIDAAVATAGDGSDGVARLVVQDVGSKALGSQKIEASCVSVVLMPSGKWTVAAAHVTSCGDKTARSILWLYKRAGNGKWNEDYVGQPPKCWKGVPADLREAVAQATRIPTC
jgi:hypothetical protein